LARRVPKAAKAVKEAKVQQGIKEITRMIGKRRIS